MDKTKYDKAWIDLLAKQLVIDVADWMGGVTLLNCPDGDNRIERKLLQTVHGRVEGDLRMQMCFAADPEMLSRMAEKLFGAPPENRAELDEYSVEYANVLFGRFVSEICRERKPKLHFCPPECLSPMERAPFETDTERSSSLRFMSEQQELAAFSWAVEDYFGQSLG